MRNEIIEMVAEYTYLKFTKPYHRFTCKNGNELIYFEFENEDLHLSFRVVA